MVTDPLEYKWSSHGKNIHRTGNCCDDGIVQGKNYDVEGPDDYVLHDVIGLFCVVSDTVLWVSLSYNITM